ncbi:MAG: glycosyltransferase family 2 protein [Muribaculaceae bacterium]|nr:glycosyltransferase family 2 protein [Muribaculaceae bacterium]
MEENLISVIVPVFNTERYLSQCLDSILSQSHRRVEVIVINDGSTDFSLEIALKYAEKDDRVVVYSNENGGPSKARNRGLEVATGDFITFVDSDDLLLPDALEIMLEVLKENDADIVEGKSVRGEVFLKKKNGKILKTKIFTPREAISDVLYQSLLLPSACGKLYKRHVLEGLTFRPGIFYEDLDLFYHYFHRSRKIVWIDFPVYFYRVAEGSRTQSWRPQRLDVLDVTERIEDYINEQYPDLLPAAKDRRLSANFNMFALCAIHGDHDNATRCWDHIKRNRHVSLFNPKVRFKNKSGILLSYLGKNTFKFISRFIYK